MDMKKYYLLLAVFCCGFVANAQIIDFPDPNFKSRLFGYGAAKDANQTTIAIDADADGEVSTDEALSVYYLNVSGISDTHLISNLEGIAYFTNLKELRCNGNLIQSLDLSGLANLDKVFCQDNRIESLNVSNTNLVFLNAGSNRIASLSDISFNEGGLDTLILSYNLLTSIDASDLPDTIWTLNFSNNQVTDVNLTGINWLTKVFCAYNQLTHIDTSGLTYLNYLSCGNNQLTTFDFMQNEYLEYLYCTNNLITSLDLSYRSIADFNLRGNNLVYLNIENGGYDAENLYDNIPNIPTLEHVCLDSFEIDDIQNWITFANINTNCTLSTGCNLSRAEFDVSPFTVSPNPAEGVLNIHSKSDMTIDAVEIYNVLGALVQTNESPGETINVSNLKSGMYLLRIVTAKGISNSKFIKK
jgi:hypothetical protein